MDRLASRPAPINCERPRGRRWTTSRVRAQRRRPVSPPQTTPTPTTTTTTAPRVPSGGPGPSPAAPSDDHPRGRLRGRTSDHPRRWHRARRRRRRRRGGQGGGGGGGGGRRWIVVSGGGAAVPGGRRARRGPRVRRDARRLASSRRRGCRIASTRSRSIPSAAVLDSAACRAKPAGREPPQGRTSGGASVRSRVAAFYTLAPGPAANNDQGNAVRWSCVRKWSTSTRAARLRAC